MIKLGQGVSMPEQPHIQQSSIYYPYYAVPRDKLVIMSVCSLGLYVLYWLYRNWMCVKYREGTKIRPLWRAYFSVLYFYPLARRLRRLMKAEGLSHGIYPLAFLGVYIFGYLLSYDESLMFVLSYIVVVPIYAMNEAVRGLNARHGLNCGDDEFSFWDRIWLLGGTTTLVLAIIMYMFPGVEF